MDIERRYIHKMTRIEFGTSVSYIEGCHIDNPCKYCTEIETYLSSSDRFTNPNQDLEKYDKSKCSCDLNGLEKEKRRLAILNLTNEHVKINVVGNYNNDNHILKTVMPRNQRDPDYYLEFSELDDEVFKHFPNLYIIYDKDSLDLSTINKFKYKDRLLKVGEFNLNGEFYTYNTVTIIKVKLTYMEKYKFLPEQKYSQSQKKRVNLDE